MNVLDAITTSPDDWYVDLRSKDNTKVKSFPVRDLKQVIREEGERVYPSSPMEWSPSGPYDE